MALDLKEDNETVQATLEEGDLVEFPRELFSHWGIYVGKGDIVHFGGVDISSTAVDSSCCSAFTKCGTGRCKASVKKEKFMEVAGQSKAKKNNDKDKTTPPLSIEEIRKNVSSKLRSTSYNPLLNNCEHFATWCRYGIATSQQVDDAGEAVKQSIETVVVAGEKAAYIYTAINSVIDSKHQDKAVLPRVRTTRSRPPSNSAIKSDQAGFVDLKALVDIGRQLNPTFTGLIDRRSLLGVGIMERAMSSLVPSSIRGMLNSFEQLPFLRMDGIHASGKFLFDMGCRSGTCVWNSTAYGMNWPK